jgi:excisionase family DNA binding protein
MNPPSIPTPWLTVEETAEYTRLSLSTVNRLIAAEKIASSVIETRPGTRNARRLIHRDDCDAYLKSCRTATNVRNIA